MRTRQNPLADILERLTLGFADADDVPKLAHHVERAVEHGRSQRIDGKIDAAAIGEGEDGLFEVFVFGNDDTLGAILQRQLLFARRAYGTDDSRAAFPGELRGE